MKIKRSKAVICDIEGTTTSIKFWGEALVPFIKYNTQKCLKERWDVPILMELINNVRVTTLEANKKGAGIPPIASEKTSKDFIIRSVVDNVIEQMNAKRHSRALQHLQMYVWLYGYQIEALKGHVFEDVSRAFNSWQKFNNIRIYTYSSGFYLTQKLLFSCSVKGNLTPLITDYFDVESYGPKTESDSFQSIAKEIKTKCENITFFSDNPKELTAAKGAGCQSVLVIRPYNLDLSDDEKSEFPSIKSFDEIKFS